MQKCVSPQTFGANRVRQHKVVFEKRERDRPVNADVYVVVVDVVTGSVTP